MTLLTKERNTQKKLGICCSKLFGAYNRQHAEPGSVGCSADPRGADPGSLSKEACGVSGTGPVSFPPSWCRWNPS